MKPTEIPIVERVQMAAMAHLDGERADLTAVEVEAYVAGCAECRGAVAALTAVQSPLDRFDYETLDVDV